MGGPEGDRRPAALWRDGRRVSPLWLSAGAALVWAGMAQPAPASSPASAWAAAASPLVPRISDHTATLLPGGKVLVAGGMVTPGEFGKPTASAELFDPVSGQWMATGPMAAPRTQHTATLLRDGRVLVAGGFDASATRSTASAEIYDPAAGRFSLTARMAEPRAGHSATLLRDGRVLVAGGLDFLVSISRPTVATAEIYDPASGRWSAIQPMGAPRIEHTATLLPDGRVLVAGGQAGEQVGDSLDAAEIYDPATGVWSVAPHLMRSKRAAHTATLMPGGTVLLTGGTSTFEEGGGGDPVASAESFDPVTLDFKPAAALRTARIAQSATLLADGGVLVAGGFGPVHPGVRVPPVISSAEVLAPGARSWSAPQPMGLPATASNFRPMIVWLQGGYHSATLLAGQPCGSSCQKVLVVGGDYGKPSAQLFDPRALAVPARHGGTASGIWLVALGVGLVAAGAAVVLIRRLGRR